MGSYEENIQEVKKGLEGLKNICKKILQAYRLRMRLFLRRYNLLLDIDKNFDNIANNPDFYTKLDNTLKKEKNLLMIIEGDEKKVGNNLSYALAQLEGYSKTLGKQFGSITLSGWARTLSVYELKTFLAKMISFLGQMEKDLEGIKKRIAAEEVFIREKSLDYFNQFIEEWDKEMVAHEKLIKDFKNALSSSQNIIECGQREGEGVIAGGLVGGVIAATVGLSLKTAAGAALGGGVGAVIVMVGFLLYFGSISKRGLQYVWKEEKLVEDFEKKRGMEKHPFLHKLFG